MPAGISDAPGTIPLQLLVLKLGLGEPEHEITLISLVAVFLHVVSNAHEKLLLAMIREHVIFFKLRGVKVNVAACQVGIALVDQSADHLDELGNAVGRGLHHVRRLNIQLCAVGKECVRIKLCDLHDRLMLTLCTLEHLVLARVRVA